MTKSTAYELSRTFGLPWYRREDWPRWLTIEPRLPKDYDVWLNGYDELLLNERVIGVEYIKVVMDPDVYLAWASAMGPGASISDYADMRARRR